MRDRGAGSARLPAVLAVTIGLIGVGLLVYAFARPVASDDPRVASPPSLATPSDATPTTPEPTAADGPSTREAGTPDRINGPVLPASAPVRLSIPRLAVSSTLESLGVDGSGAMEVPDDPDQAGWYRLGPTPGALGPAVIAGHVTWNQVPAVFYSLAELRRDDAVEVTRRDGRVAIFRVTEVRRYAKSDFPTRSVFGALDHAGLRLITCGGDYDGSAHRYSDNVVVFARLVDTA